MLYNYAEKADVDPLARQADNALNQHLIVVVKSDNIAGRLRLLHLQEAGEYDF